MPNSVVAPTFIGIDLGTSGCRACLIDADAKLLQEARVSFPDPKIKDSQVEQDAEIWWQAVQKVLTELAQHPACRSLAAISVDGTSSTLLVTDEHYQPLAPALMYNDARASQQAERIEAIAPQSAAAVFGASSSLSKLLWLTEQHPQTKKALHQADYINGKLSDHYVSDFNNCLKMGFDPMTESWPDWLSDLSVATDMLPEVVAPGTVIGALNKTTANLLQLKHSVQLVAGTTDSIAGFLATGADQAGDAVTSLGSTLVIKILSPVAINSPAEGIYSHKINNMWLAGGASNAGCAVLSQFFNDETLQRLSDQLSFGQPTGLKYYPLLKTGERFPESNPDKQSCLSPRPEQDSVFLQAILEALTAIEKQGFDNLSAKGAKQSTRLFTVGGGTKNTKWMAYRQQQLDSDVIIPEHTEACYGTALLARQGFMNTHSMTTINTKAP